MDTEIIYDINRLIYFSLIYSTKKSSALIDDVKMTELIQRFQAEASFRELVEAGIKALSLRLLAIEDNGLRLSARGADSFFAANVTDYGKLLARGDLKAADILMVHCAVATAFFPAESDLDAPIEDLGAIVITDVVEVLRRYTRTESALPEDDERLHPQLRTVAGRLRKLPEDNPDRLRAGAGNSWVDLIRQVLEHMVETGYLLRAGDMPGETEYWPTPAYQTAMREGIVYSFHAFRDVLSEAELREASSATEKKAEEE